MRKRIMIVGALLVLALGGATYAVAGGGAGSIFDDGKYVQPGTLDDGKELQSQTKISLADATAAAQKAADGGLGQVDLERSKGGIVYMVDIGSNEVRVDADDGSIESIRPEEKD